MERHVGHLAAGVTTGVPAAPARWQQDFEPADSCYARLKRSPHGGSGRRQIEWDRLVVLRGPATGALAGVVLINERVTGSPVVTRFRCDEGPLFRSSRGMITGHERGRG